MLTRRSTLSGLTAGAIAGSDTASAQGFPARPITLICPIAAGGSTDVILRAMAEIAGRQLGQQVIVDNRAGASGTLGPAVMAATSKPDGYTISQMPINTVRLPLMQKMAYDPIKDFTYIILLTGYVFGITSRGDGPFKTWANVLELAKSNPGKVTYGSAGTGSTMHIGMEQMAAHSGIKLTHVPFKGEAEIFAALMGGHIDLMAAGTGRAEMIATGQIHILTICAEKRSKRIPDVPTLKELGYPFVFDSPFGLAGPRGMDPAVVRQLHDAFKRALEDKTVHEIMDKYEMAPNYLGSADYTALVPRLVENERAYLAQMGLLRKD